MSNTFGSMPHIYTNTIKKQETYLQSFNLAYVPIIRVAKEFNGIDLFGSKNNYHIRHESVIITTYLLTFNPMTHAS